MCQAGIVFNVILLFILCFELKNWEPGNGVLGIIFFACF